jgi:hypothetical protein
LPFGNALLITAITVGKPTITDKIKNKKMSQCGTAVDDPRYDHEERQTADISRVAQLRSHPDEAHVISATIPVPMTKLKTGSFQIFFITALV